MTLKAPETIVSAKPVLEQSRWSITSPDGRQPSSRTTTMKRHLPPLHPSLLSQAFGVLPFFVLTRSSAHDAVDPGCSWLCRPVRCERAPKCDVHCQSGSTKQRECRGPVVLRRHCHVDVAKSCVALHCHTHFGAHPGQRPLELPHSQCASDTCRGKRRLSRITVLKSPASMRNSGFVGHTLDASEASGPE